METKKSSSITTRQDIWQRSFSPAITFLLIPNWSNVCKWCLFNKAIGRSSGRVTIRNIHAHTTHIPVATITLAPIQRCTKNYLLNYMSLNQLTVYHLLLRWLPLGRLLKCESMLPTIVLSGLLLNCIWIIILYSENRQYSWFKPITM